MNRIRPNLVLIGFMGSGKSSIGKLAAGLLRFDFVDTDQLIVSAAGMPITEIFARHGEAHFRILEQQALAKLTGRSGLVIATGGGIVTVPENVPVLKSLGLVAWLTASEEVLYDRVARNQKRPLLRTENPRQTLHDLLEQRNPIYEGAADFRLDSTDLKHSEAAKRLASALDSRS